MFDSPFAQIGFLPSFVSALSEVQLIALLTKLGKSYKLLYSPDKAGPNAELAFALGEKQSLINQALSSLEGPELASHTKSYINAGPAQKETQIIELQYSRLVTRLAAITEAIELTKRAINEKENHVANPDYDFWFTALYSHLLGDKFEVNTLFIRHTSNISISVVDESDKKTQAVLNELEEFLRLDESVDQKEQLRISLLESKLSNKGKKKTPPNDHIELAKLKQARAERKEYIAVLKNAVIKKYSVSGVGMLKLGGKETGIKILGSAMTPEVDKINDVLPQISLQTYLTGIDKKGRFVILGEITDFDKRELIDAPSPVDLSFEGMATRVSPKRKAPQVVTETEERTPTTALSIGLKRSLYEKNPFEILGIMPEFLKSLENKGDLKRHVMSVIKVMKELFHTDNHTTANEELFREISSAEKILSDVNIFDAALEEYVATSAGDGKIKALKREMCTIQEQIEKQAHELAQFKIDEVRAARKNADRNRRHDLFFKMLFEGLYGISSAPSSSLESLFIHASAGHSITVSSEEFGTRKYDLSVDGFDVFAASASSSLRLIGSTISNVFQHQGKASAVLSKFKGVLFSGAMPYLEPTIKEGSFLVATGESNDVPIVIGKIEKIEMPKTKRKGSGRTIHKRRTLS